MQVRDVRKLFESAATVCNLGDDYLLEYGCRPHNCDAGGVCRTKRNREYRHVAESA